MPPIKGNEIAKANEIASRLGLTIVFIGVLPSRSCVGLMILGMSVRPSLPLYTRDCKIVVGTIEQDETDYDGAQRRAYERASVLMKTFESNLNKNSLADVIFCQDHFAAGIRPHYDGPHCDIPLFTGTSTTNVGSMEQFWESWFASGAKALFFDAEGEPEKPSTVSLAFEDNDGIAYGLVFVLGMGESSENNLRNLEKTIYESDANLYFVDDDARSDVDRLESMLGRSDIRKNATKLGVFGFNQIRFFSTLGRKSVLGLAQMLTIIGIPTIKDKMTNAQEEAWRYPIHTFDAVRFCYALADALGGLLIYKLICKEATAKQLLLAPAYEPTVTKKCHNNAISALNIFVGSQAGERLLSTENYGIVERTDPPRFSGFLDIKPISDVVWQAFPCTTYGRGFKVHQVNESTLRITISERFAKKTQVRHVLAGFVLRLLKARVPLPPTAIKEWVDEDIGFGFPAISNRADAQNISELQHCPLGICLIAALLPLTLCLLGYVM